MTGTGDQHSLPGPLLASGRDADVYDLGGGRVLRRYKDATKSSEPDAGIIRSAQAWGYPVPEVYEVSGPDMVMERVDGPTMLTDLITRPWMVERHARTLAKLHRQLHGIPAPDWLPTYASHPAFAGLELPPPPPGSVPVPDALLHLDLHPDNVILSPRGPVVIDWRNARRGDGNIDVASTWLILDTSEIPNMGVKGRVLDVVRRLFVVAFLRHVDRAAATRQLPLVARYRLADRNLLTSERPNIHALLGRNGLSLEVLSTLRSLDENRDWQSVH
ncbi:MAG: phosphotransferase [Chloroflexota bacterium]